MWTPQILFKQASHSFLIHLTQHVKSGFYKQAVPEWEWAVTLRLSHGSEIVSLMHQPPFNLRKIPGTHFCYRVSLPQDYNVAGRIRSTEKSSDPISN
jgi:hypothetical protein